MDFMLESYYSFFNGNKQGLKDIINSFSEPLYGFILSFVKDEYVCEDILEEVFLAIIIKKRKIKDETAFKSYLFSMARNKSLDYIRRHKNKFCELNDDFVDARYAPEENLDEKIKNEIVKDALNKLNADHYAVIYLSFFEQMKNQQIAKILKKSSKQVENLLFNAKAKLRKELGDIRDEK